jgi:hypothetical protein
MQEDFFLPRESYARPDEEQMSSKDVHGHIHEREHHSIMAPAPLHEGHGHMVEGFFLLKKACTPIRERENLPK